ncbi:hypothetical protein GCM10010121_060610 [Streptomyces brasiliensis]|uniref:Uncharacterized protein n=1 Tax=Streptomyces brasiliensis TaxID=1954 RepID=A0A917L432_9ACTN|nr:hypothetical protein GCM10010121_060610 [Streptomyces brasiliensis]
MPLALPERRVTTVSPVISVTVCVPDGTLCGAAGDAVVAVLAVFAAAGCASARTTAPAASRLRCLYGVFKQFPCGCWEGPGLRPSVNPVGEGTA